MSSSSSSSDSFDHCDELTMDDDPHHPGSTIITITNIINPKPKCFQTLQTRAVEIEKKLSAIHLKFDERVQLPTRSDITSALAAWKDLMIHETSSSLSDVKIVFFFHNHPIKHVHEFLDSFLSVNKTWTRNHLGKINVQSEGDAEEDVNAFKSFMETQGLNFALNEHKEEEHVDKETGMKTAEETSTSIQEESDPSKHAFTFSKSVVSSSSSSSSSSSETEEKSKEGGVTTSSSSSSPWSCEKCRLRTLRKKHRKDKKKKRREFSDRKSRRKKRRHHHYNDEDEY